MNKLIIIGNGFDLAHNLKTKYADFLLWYLNKSFHSQENLSSNKIEDDSLLLKIYSLYQPEDQDSIQRYLDFAKDKTRLFINYHYEFIEELIKDADINWVDIEKKYFLSLIDKIRYFIDKNVALDDTSIKEIENLNKCIDIIREELEKYLMQINEKRKIRIESIEKHFKNLIKRNDKICFLNFNYTNTLDEYLKDYLVNNNILVIDIHGKIKDKKNPIIFGYGDETNKFVEKLEDFDNNELTRNLKSFNYLTTYNYQNLFNFLSEGSFEVHIMGHSCGISDRLLFTNIFQHISFEKVKLYYHQYGKEKWKNDFFQKTQELSRHFSYNSKHIMRTKVIPFSESEPLVPYREKLIVVNDD